MRQIKLLECSHFSLTVKYYRLHANFYQTSVPAPLTRILIVWNHLCKKNRKKKKYLKVHNIADKADFEKTVRWSIQKLHKICFFFHSHIDPSRFSNIFSLHAICLDVVYYGMNKTHFIQFFKLTMSSFIPWELKRRIKMKWPTFKIAKLQL